MLLDAAARERTAADRDLLEHARIPDDAHSGHRLTVQARGGQPVWRPTSLKSVIPVGTSANWGFRGAVGAARMSRTTVSPCASVGGEVAAPASACGVGWLHASLCASQLVGLGLAFLQLHRPEVPGYSCERRARASRAALRTARCPDAFDSIGQAPPPSPKGQAGCRPAGHGAPATMIERSPAAGRRERNRALGAAPDRLREGKWLCCLTFRCILYFQGRISTARANSGSERHRRGGISGGHHRGHDPRCIHHDVIWWPSREGGVVATHFAPKHAAVDWLTRACPDPRGFWWRSTVNSRRRHRQIRCR